MDLNGFQNGFKSWTTVKSLNGLIQCCWKEFVPNNSILYEIQYYIESVNLNNWLRKG